VGDLELVMLRVDALLFANGAEVIIRAHNTLETWAVKRLLTSITNHARVENLLLVRLTSCKVEKKKF
jgi:hypothetical protein